MLEFESAFSSAIVESVISEFSLALTIKYESKPYAVGLLNIIFLLTSFTTRVSLKSLSTLLAIFFETYRYITSISGRLHLKFLKLSIAETITGVNEASSSGKGLSLFLFQV